MKYWPLYPLLLVVVLLQTGCASTNNTGNANLSPGTIRTSFDGVRVHLAGSPPSQLVITLTDNEQSLESLRVVSASSSTWTTEKNLNLQQTIFSPTDPHLVTLIFTPAPKPPFSVNLVTTVSGQTMTLRADFYGPHAITF